LLGFGLDATRNQIAVLVLASLTRKKEQLVYAGGFRIRVALTRERSVFVLGDVRCVK